MKNQPDNEAIINELAIVEEVLKNSLKNLISYNATPYLISRYSEAMCVMGQLIASDCDNHPRLLGHYSQPVELSQNRFSQDDIDKIKMVINEEMDKVIKNLN